MAREICGLYLGKMTTWEGFERAADPLTVTGDSKVCGKYQRTFAFKTA